MKTVVILGSGPGVLVAQDWPRVDGITFVAINNAWQVRPDWDWLIHPEDFPPERRPRHVLAGQKIVTAQDYVPIQNAYGGFVYAGGTMAFTAAYWALGALRPKVIGFIGCDMVYPREGPTHFYGTGTADPLRQNVSLRSLEAKSARLLALAARDGCALVNLSTAPRSRLVFSRADYPEFAQHPVATCDDATVSRALAAEADAGFYVPSGRYWEEEERFETDVIDRIDTQWLDTTRALAR